MPPESEFPLELWRSLFAAATSARSATQNDLYPYWIAPGPYKILRHIPALPHSREQIHKHDLMRTLTVYRMVFGQSRQEDLVQYLLRSLPVDQVDAMVERCRISLAPLAVTARTVADLAENRKPV